MSQLARTLAAAAFLAFAAAGLFLGWGSPWAIAAFVIAAILVLF